MSRPMIRIHNTETDEIVDREMNKEELDFYNKITLEGKILREELEQKEKNRISALAKLAALGLNEDEIAAL